MAIIWLRVALALYGLGLVYVLVALTRTKELLNRLSLHAAYLGMIFHFVAIAEAVHQSGELGLASLSVAASVLGFLIMVVFLLVYMIYQTTSPGIVVFPLVFLLTFLVFITKPYCFFLFLLFFLIPQRKIPSKAKYFIYFIFNTVQIIADMIVHCVRPLPLQDLQLGSHFCTPPLVPLLPSAPAIPSPAATGV